MNLLVNAVAIAAIFGGIGLGLHTAVKNGVEHLSVRNEMLIGLAILTLICVGFIIIISPEFGKLELLGIGMISFGFALTGYIFNTDLSTQTKQDLIEAQDFIDEFHEGHGTYSQDLNPDNMEVENE